MIKEVPTRSPLRSVRSVTSAASLNLLKTLKTCVVLALCACGGGSGAFDFAKSRPVAATFKWSLDSNTPLYGPGATLYLLVQDGFIALDTTSCANPNITSSGGAVVGGQNQFIALRGPHLYYRDGINRFHAYDLTDPKQPTELGLAPNLPFTEFIGALEYRPSPDAMLITDWSNPLSPQAVGSVSVSGLLFVKAEGGHLFAQDATGVLVFDVSDPRHPTVAHHVDLSGGSLNVAFPSGFAWLVGADSTAQTIEGTTPAQAHAVGKSAAIPPGLRSTSKDGRYWFTQVVEGGTGVRRTFDLVDPSAPRLLTEEKGSSDDPSVLSLDEQCEYVTTREGVTVYAR